MSDATRLRLTFSLLMSGLMSLLMTGWVSWLNLGFGPDFVARWGHAFVAAWPAAFSIVLILAPGVQRLSQRLTARRLGRPSTC
ncbi:DUF2798 domain-containing protein [Neisseriaceae bacterium JH1-16]|nr:DUF2798 domain-containing protein [Neisseriaceae bacterium JH1-16]